MITLYPLELHSQKLVAITRNCFSVRARNFKRKPTPVACFVRQKIILVCCAEEYNPAGHNNFEGCFKQFAVGENAKPTTKRLIDLTSE